MREGVCWACVLWWKTKVYYRKCWSTPKGQWSNNSLEFSGKEGRSARADSYAFYRNMCRKMQTTLKIAEKQEFFFKKEQRKTCRLLGPSWTLSHFISGNNIERERLLVLCSNWARAKYNNNNETKMKRKKVMRGAFEWWGWNFPWGNRNSSMTHLPNYQSSR